MRSLKLLLAAASVSALGLCIAAPASAQVTARVVSACGSPTYVAGTNNYQTIDTSGYLCGKMTATITGTSDTNLISVGGVTLLRGAGATGTGSQRITVAQDTTTVAGSPSLPAGSAIVGKFGIDQTTPGTTNGVQVNAALPAGSNTIGGVTPAASASGGATPSHAIVAANTTSVAVDASPGTLYSVQLFNNSGTVAYAKFYDAAQGSTTCGSGTPKKVLMIPANTSGAGVVINVGGQAGVAFATAITRCVVTGIADNDATAPAASTYLVESDFK